MQVSVRDSRAARTIGSGQRFEKYALFGAPGTFWCKLVIMKEIKKSTKTRSAYRKLEDVIGCKWSVSVLVAIGEGVIRPGALERHITGISKKVLSERLRKLTGFGLLEKHSFAEVPPRTEYSLTQHGHRVVRVIADIRELDAELSSGAGEEVQK